MSEQAGCGSGRGELWFSDTLPICQKERKEKGEGKVAGIEREREETESVQAFISSGKHSLVELHLYWLYLLCCAFYSLLTPH